ncbi:hypothetical protein [Tepidibacter hydrothermalis]|uniref:Uncharacterized protein n=1 Tax=Tepidibacter hydrothermalis TaxID=3036126 RepID=A0ABY8EAN4_9FIRM|nr:hypothetical protein [Tepidibacter hydrothermalis]WFD08659.1 hypothetical protein P4S50_09620 [Tepidibacter hydrothermalis]
MKDVNAGGKFSIFSGISNLINNASTLDDDELEYLEQMVDHYINNHGTQAECLLETLSMMKKNRDNYKRR